MKWESPKEEKVIFAKFSEAALQRYSQEKVWSKFKVEHPCRSVISIKLQGNFIEMTLRHGCFPVKFSSLTNNLLSKKHVFLHILTSMMEGVAASCLK